MENKVLDIKNLDRVFRIGGMIMGNKIKAVDNVSIQMPSDRAWIMSVVGESGSGKTTLAKMVLGLLDISGGDIMIQNKSVAYHMKHKKDFYRLVQPIFQNPFTAFNMKRTVESYLFETALNLDMAKNKEEAQALISETLKRVGLNYDQVKKKYPNQFSGGELQRISIARALITKPKIIVADEPVAMIDASLRMNIVNIFKNLKEEFGVSFIYITHDLSTAYYVSDYIATMYKGSMIEFGKAKEVLNNPGHPYTELLLDSIPKVGAKWTAKDRLKMGDAEERVVSKTGCKFAKRCPYAKDACFSVSPNMVQLEGDHRSLCMKHTDYKVG
jgi:peptide/nickel transport system ATP-binding protein